MEPRQEKKVTEPRPAAEQEKPRRFRLIRLEERIAPKVATHKGCGWTL
jgi:hypothetical protein